MRVLLPLALVGLTAACAPAPSHLQSSTGFGTGATGYGAPAPAYAGQTAYGPGVVAGAPGAAPGAIPSSEINTALFGAPTAPGAAPAAPLPAPGTTAVAGVAPTAPGSTGAGLSDEQDFQAVSSRETIESDKARIEANKAQYVQIQPGELPQRSGEAVSPVIAYAISAPNGLGQSLYTRRSVKPEAHAAACQRYASDEAAQEAFLKAGGPDRDPKKLDPDGDGWACKFDPTPYRQAGN